MKINFIVSFLFTIIFFQNEIFSQNQLWEIYTISNQPFVNITVDKYESDSLYVKSMGQLFILHQDSIKYLLKRRESYFGLGFLFGSIAGGLLGAASSSGSDGFFSDLGKSLSIISGAIIGGIIGGIGGLAAGADEKYRLDRLTTEKKRELLNNLIH